MKTYRLCGHCWKPIWQARSLAWYHRSSASVSCHPGDGRDGKKAYPSQKTVTLPGPGGH